MKKGNYEEFQKNKKDILIGVIASLIATFVLHFFPKFIILIYNTFFSIIDRFTTSYSNGVFQVISFGENVSPVSHIFLISTYLFFIFIINIPMVKPSYNVLRRIAKLYTYLLTIVIIFYVSKCSYINRCVNYMNQNIKIASCYLTDDEIKTLNAEYYSIETKNDYIILLEKLENLANQHGTKFYNPFS